MIASFRKPDSPSPTSALADLRSRCRLAGGGAEARREAFETAGGGAIFREPDGAVPQLTGRTVRTFRTLGLSQTPAPART